MKHLLSVLLVATVLMGVPAGSAMAQDNPRIDLEKSTSVQGPSGPWHNADRPTTAVGSDIWMRIWIRNSGNSRLTNFELTDVTISGDGVDYQTPLDSAIANSDCPPLPDLALDTWLGQGAEWECVLGPFPALEDLHENRATVDSDSLDEDGDINFTNIGDSDPAGYEGVQSPANPGIDLEKEVSVDGGNTWFDADSQTGPLATAGANNVFFRFIVTNTGDVTLEDIELTDTDFTIPANQVPATLAPGADFTIVIGPYVAQVGQHHNTATATANAVGGSGGNNEPPPFDGNNYSYVFVFENGTVAAGTSEPNEVDLGLGLSDDTHISCSDKFGFESPNDNDPDGWGEKGAPDIDDDPGWRLSGYAIVKYNSDGTVNKTCGSGDTSGGKAMDMDPTHYMGEPPTPTVDLEKEVSVDGGNTWFDADSQTGPLATAGANNVFFRFIVTNTGDVTLEDIELTDTDFTIPANQVPATLAPGADFTIVIGPYVAQVGQHHNTATATANAVGGSGGNNEPPPFDGNNYSYVFVFENGTVAAGTSEPNEVDLGLGLSDDTHISCSDKFGFESPNDNDPDGWGEKGAPDIDDDPGWRLSGYAIVKYNSDGTVNKTCGSGDTSGGKAMDMDPTHYMGANVAPAVTLSGPATADESDAKSYGFTTSDPGEDAFSLVDQDCGTAGVLSNLSFDSADGSGGFHCTFPDGPDTSTVRVQVADSGGANSNISSIQVLIDNVAPTVTAGGEVIDEDGVATVSGTITDPGTLDTFIVVVDWGEGSPVSYSYPAGAAGFSETHQYLDDNPTGSPSDVYPIGVTVTDDDGGVGTTDTTVTVNNVAPVFASVASSATLEARAGEGEPVTVSGAFTDAGTLDIHDVVIDWDDGTTTSGIVTQGLGGGTFTGSHSYLSGGVYTVTVTVTDDDTGATSAATTSVVVGVGVHEGVLQVLGTDDKDHIDIKWKKGNLIEVKTDFSEPRKQLFPGDDVTSLLVMSFASNDHIHVDKKVTLPATLDGGGGKDHVKAGAGPSTLIGGSGNDHLDAGDGPTVMLGGDGNDKLHGGKGRDVLIGGLGLDDLKGGDADDVLIGGTAFDTSDSALDAIRADWTSSNDFDTRVANLSTALAANLTVFDDGASDELKGGRGRDWLFADIDGLDDDDDSLKGVKGADVVALL